jgi:hypothetical protein
MMPGNPANASDEMDIVLQSKLEHVGCFEE